MKIKSKLYISIIVISIVIIGMIISTRVVSKSQKKDGLVINLAGRQRMLSQKMAKESLIIGAVRLKKEDDSEHVKNIYNTVKLFDETLIALSKGKIATVDGETKQLCPKPSNVVEEQLKKVKILWDKQKKDIEDLINKNTDSDYTKIPMQSLPILKESNTAVMLMQKESEKKVKALFIIEMLGLIFGAASITIIFMVIKSILSKLSIVNELLDRYSKGDLTERPKNVPKGDELNDTIRRTNRLAEGIAAIISEIYAANATLSNTINELYNSFEMIGQKAESMSNGAANIAAAGEEASSSISLVAQSADQMSNSVATIASAMEEMSASINEVSTSCQKESEIAADASDKVVVTQSNMDKLANSAQEIGRVISVISDIADKTNLLALNATIEAASAGEAGKGFAVVANEIKELARQTSNATDEIRSLIETIQQDSDKSVSAMNNITNTINEVNTISQAIVASVGEQSSATNEMAESVSHANNQASEMATNISESSVGLREVSENIQKVDGETTEVASELDGMKNDVNNLKILSNELTGVVSAFKIKTQLIEWDNSLSVGHSKLDSQHKVLINLINKLNEAFAEGKTKSSIGEILKELAEYTVSHFSEEEKLMMEGKYPDIENHKRVHVKFVSTVKTTIADFESGKSMVSKDLMIFLKEWLIEHIMGTDQKYSSYVKGI